jgi:hypothetical protein
MQRALICFRNLFAIDFQKMHDGKGTNAQFDAAWQALREEERAVRTRSFIVHITLY